MLKQKSTAMNCSRLTLFFFFHFLFDSKSIDRINYSLHFASMEEKKKIEAKMEKLCYMNVIGREMCELRCLRSDSIEKETFIRFWLNQIYPNWSVTNDRQHFFFFSFSFQRYFSSMIFNCNVKCISYYFFLHLFAFRSFTNNITTFFFERGICYSCGYSVF